MRRIGASAVVFLLSLCAVAGYAQNATTSLRGTIKDPSGAVVPGATITLVNKAAGQTLKVTSKSGGDYQLQQIPPAKYLITVTAPGFGSQSKAAELLVDQPSTVDFALTVTESNVVVDVTAAAQTINTNDAALGSSTDNATIQAIPSEERNVPDLLSLEPGVLFLPNSGDSRTGAVNGGRSDQGNITLDGVDDNDQVNGYAFTGVLRETQDSVEEFRVTTGNANADAGRSSGAQVSLLTKGGTNKYHGAAYEYFRPTNTVSNDYFNKQAQLQQGLPNRPAKLVRNTFGADVGGFIVKDKLFFFGNYEGLRRAESQIVTRTTPTALYQAGVLQYPSNGSVVQVSKAQLATLDAANGCDPSVCNTAAYPYGPGVNPNALAYLNSLPTANGTLTGDGYNTGSYTFPSPNPYDLNTSIVRLDYTPSSKHRLFVRGNLQKDTVEDVEQFPGQGPADKTITNNKGITAGETWTISSNMVNDLRYGYVRAGYGTTGVASGEYVDFRFISDPTAETRNTIASSPVNNIIDNFSMTRGKHNIEFGVNWRLIHQNRLSDANSYNSASTNPYWLSGNPPDPSTIGLGPVDGGFGNSYEIAYSELIGAVPSVTDNYNYHADSASSGTLLAEGAPLDRHFKANEFEGFVQDSWRILPNFTITAGVRYTVLQTPYETKGQEVKPTIDTDTWYKKRESEALQGNIYEENLEFSPAGPYYKKPGFYPKSKDNFAPRLAFAYSPDAKTSLRAGAGIYYDHFGEGLVNIFDQNGAFGLTSSVTNPAGTLTDSTAPRYTARNVLPFNNGIAPAQQVYPYLAPTEAPQNFAITWGLDSKIKTPYSENFDLSLQHEIGAGFTVEIAYVGRYGQHLLQSLDLAEPVDYTDPQGAGDYYKAAKTLSQVTDQNGQDPSASVQAIPYFENVFPFMAGIDFPGESATQAIYSDEWAPYRSTYGATTSLSDIDFFCYYGCPDGYQSKFWQDQFSSLYALASIGKSYYNAGQWTLRHPMSHGIQINASYTFSKSIDWGSDAERNTEFSGQGGISSILNTWKPYLNKAVSDFDTANLLTIDWVAQVPVGKGKRFLGTANPLVNALVGGWQSSGIFRLTSGLPFSFFEPGWTTDWQIESYGVVTDKRAYAKKHIDVGGNPQYFENPGGDAATINNGVYTGTPVRLPYAGEAGQRNNFRGDGYLDLDSGLSKSWSLERYGALKFAWEVYNVTNVVRFDPLSVGSGLTSGNLGIASSELTQPRRMQFLVALRFLRVVRPKLSWPVEGAISLLSPAFTFRATFVASSSTYEIISYEKLH